MGGRESTGAVDASTLIWEVPKIFCAFVSCGAATVGMSCFLRPGTGKLNRAMLVWLCELFSGMKIEGGGRY